MTRSRRFGCGIAVLAAFTLRAVDYSWAATNSTSNQPTDRLVVHEWGTFTSLEDETGMPLGGINVDDEPVPPFVHQMMRSFVLGSQQYDRDRENGKGAPSRYPYVTLRLETPVMYFYPPKSQSTPLAVNVEVVFKGGWLSQFYPSAQTDLPQPKTLGDLARLPLTHTTSSKLTWNNLHVGTRDSGPQTDEAVWLTPRNVAAANVTTPEGESERYLFYRGVGNVDSPISVESNKEQAALSLRGRFDEVLQPSQSETIRKLWLVKIKPDGRAAFRALEPIQVTADRNKVAADVKADFVDADFAQQNIDDLRREMHEALVAEGLFDDEAAAMLQTWEKSYFRSGGWRLFFLVPRSWTEHYLPLTISQPADITRVMVGRIELVSPEQRELLKRLAKTQISDLAWIKNIHDSSNARKFFSGHSDFGDLGVPIPPDYQLYLSLGRFRSALIVNEQSHVNSPALAKFISNYDLTPFQVSDPSKQ